MCASERSSGSGGKGGPVCAAWRALAPSSGVPQARARRERPSATAVSPGGAVRDGASGPDKRPGPRRRRNDWGQALRQAEEIRVWEELLPHLPESVRRIWTALGDMRQLWRVLAAYGGHLDDLVLDEPADMERQVWSQVFRPMLADRQGRALFCGTPRGTDNLLYDVWQESGADTSGLWSRFRFPASATGCLPAAELAAARRAMDESEYRQEFECSFAAALRGAYYAALLDQAETEGRITRLAPDPALPVHTAWDLGMDDATAIWFFQAEPSGAWRMLDYYEAGGEGLAHYARVLRCKAAPAGTGAPGDMPALAGRGFVYGQHIAPRDIRVRELGTGQSRLESAAALGIRFSVAPGLPLADGIDATRRRIPRLWFDAEHCAPGIKALRAYRRQWRRRGEASGPLHDWTSHAADALRYAATGFRPSAAAGTAAPGRARTGYDIFGERCGGVA